MAASDTHLILFCIYNFLSIIKIKTVLRWPTSLEDVWRLPKMETNWLCTMSANSSLELSLTALWTEINLLNLLWELVRLVISFVFLGFFLKKDMLSRHFLALRTSKTVVSKKFICVLFCVSSLYAFPWESDQAPSPVCK